MLPADLLSVLACPKSKQPLIYFPPDEGEDGFLVCPASKLQYRIEHGVPVMLVEEAQPLTDAQVADLIAVAHELNLAVPTT